MRKLQTGVRGVFWILLRWDVGSASATLPHEEEEPQVATYAAAESAGIAGRGFQTETTKAVLPCESSAGGGRVLRMCRCLQDDAVWKRRQNDVEAVLWGAFGTHQRRVEEVPR